MREMVMNPYSRLLVLVSLMAVSLALLPKLELDEYTEERYTTANRLPKSPLLAIVIVNCQN
jgi:hypothetical protein